MSEPRRIMAKVVLVGDKSVGKTSLIRRYVLDQFDDRYLLTLGTKVTKKIEDVRIPDQGVHVALDLNVWDIMGQAGFRELAKEAYFHGARGILAVADLTRRATLDSVRDWIRAVEEVTGPVPLVLLANKNDLTAEAAISPGQIAETARTFGCSSFRTSAKTGESVEAAFCHLSERIVRTYVAH